MTSERPTTKVVKSPRCPETKQDNDDLVTWYCGREEGHRGRHHWTNPESLAKKLYDLAAGGSKSHD